MNDNRKEVLSRRDEVRQICLDIKMYDKVIWFAKNKIFQHFNPPTYIFKAEEKIISDYKNSIAIFLIAHEPGIESISIVKNINHIKSLGGVVLCITDSISWGWCGLVTDYRFMMPPTSSPANYLFIFKLIHHYLKQK